MQTIFYKNKPIIKEVFSVGGPKEGQSNIGQYIDISLPDDMAGEKTFEKAETKILYLAIKNAVKKAKLDFNSIDTVIAGDLLNQIIASTFSIRNFDVAYLGAYNACATFAESITIGSMLIDGGYNSNVVCATSSHFSSAERQYRYPLELGSTRPPLSQWTVTGAGAGVISKEGIGPKVICSTIGKIVDYGVTDANNMGAAMAGACANTIFTHFKETNFTPEDYDYIITGDLGSLGSKILVDLLWEKGVDIQKQQVDCGKIIYKSDDKEYQGGSGAGCSSLVFCSYFYKLLLQKKIKRVLLVCTGALLSSLTSFQGESIPGIAHAVCLEA